VSDFWEQYKRPEWQKKRLEVMESAGFACQECYSETNTLTVHHTFYVRGRKPWEYPNDSLQCLCKECHEKRTQAAAELKLMIGQLDEMDLRRLTGYVKGLLSADWRAACDESRFTVNSGEECQGLADAFGVHWEFANRVVRALDDNNSITADEVRAVFTQTTTPTEGV
jgi:hypothetical protein